MTDKRQAAFDWAARGFRVFPLQPNSKFPYPGRSWKSLVCQDEMQAWDFWSREEYADANIGVHCEGLVVVDVDAGKVPSAASSYAAMGLPDTLTVQTPSGGYHYYFSGPDVPNSASRLAPGIDIRGCNGYVVAPGSTTPAGAYTVRSGELLHAAPPGLVALCGAATRREEERSVDWTAGATAAPRIADAKEYLLDERTRVSVEGCGGNSTAFEVISGLFDRGVNPAEALDLLHANWNERCLPPWSDDELHTLVHNVYTYASGHFGSRAVDAMFGNAFVPAEVKPDQGFRMVSAASFQDTVLPDREWLVHNWIPAQNVTLLYGDGAVGKSLLASQLAVAVCTNSEWVGEPVRKHGPVVVLAAEDDEDEQQRRLRAILGPHGSYADLRDLHIIARAGKDAALAKFDKNEDMTTTALWSALADAVQQVRPKLVILDNLADIFHGNEISKVQARQFVNLLRAMAITCDTTVVVLAHPSQSGMASGEGTSGNTAWSNSVRSRLYMEREKEKPGIKTDPNARVLTGKKMNYAEQGKQVFMRWEDGKFARTETKEDLDAAKRQAIAEKVAAILAEQNTASMQALQVAKMLVACDEDAALILRANNADYVAVKKWAMSALAGGQRLASGDIVGLEGDAIVLR